MGGSAHQDAPFLHIVDPCRVKSVTGRFVVDRDRYVDG
jgi:hypothetical protein